MSVWQENLKRVTSSKDAYEKERARAENLLLSGEAKDPKAAAKWINELDAIMGGIYTVDGVISGKQKGSTIYIPRGTEISNGTMKEIEKQYKEGKAVADVGTKKQTSINSYIPISNNTVKTSYGGSERLVVGDFSDKGIMGIIAIIFIIALLK